MNNTTITPTPRGQAIQLPAETAKKYRFTRPLFGGPVFDFPAYGLTGVNFAALTEQQAERLFRAGWPGLERVSEQPVKNTFVEGPAPSKTEKP